MLDPEEVDEPYETPTWVKLVLIAIVVGIIYLVV